MPITPEIRRTTRKINLVALDQQLQAEAGEMQTSVTDPDELAFVNYVFVAAHVGVFWIGGDPYSYRFPKPYEGERLARLCAYLKRLEGKDFQVIYTERDKQVTLLRDVTWPAYSKVCASYTYHGDSGTTLEMGYEWCGIDSLASEYDPEAPADAPPPYLPKFHALESEAFHCNVLAVIYLNRVVKAPLLDLDVTPF